MFCAILNFYDYIDNILALFEEKYFLTPRKGKLMKKKFFKCISMEYFLTKR